jgi:hypothetical protein
MIVNVWHLREGTEQYQFIIGLDESSKEFIRRNFNKLYDKAAIITLNVGDQDVALVKALSATMTTGKEKSWVKNTPTIMPCGKALEKWFARDSAPGDVFGIEGPTGGVYLHVLGGWEQLA